MHLKNVGRLSVMTENENVIILMKTKDFHFPIKKLKLRYYRNSSYQLYIKLKI